MKAQLIVWEERIADLVVFLSLTGITSVVILLSVIPGLAADEIKNKEVVNRSNGIEITIEGTRAQFSAGTPLGVSAQIANKFDKTIYLNEKYTILNVPAEIEGPFTYADSYWWAFLPTANHGLSGEETFRATLALKPGDVIKAFWLVSPKVVGEKYEKSQLPPVQTRGRAPSDIADKQTGDGEESRAGNNRIRGYAALWIAIKNVVDEILTELNFVFFTPGDYKLTVSLNYWLHPVPPFTEDYRVAVQTAAVRVMAPQSVILLGASIGGLMAYIILPQGRQRQTQNTSSIRMSILKEVLGILGAILLSAIVTILLSRLSDSQFLIRVSISDFWGAIAIGFVSNYLGYEILRRLIGAEKEGAPSQEKSIESSVVEPPKDSNKMEDHMIDKNHGVVLKRDSEHKEVMVEPLPRGEH